MIDDKEILEEEFRKFMVGRRKEEFERLKSFLKVVKIVMFNIFAFVGFSMLFYHFILGQPYVCVDEPQNCTPEIEYIEANCDQYPQELRDCEQAYNDCQLDCVESVLKSIRGGGDE